MTVQPLRLAASDTPPASPDAVRQMMSAARLGGSALALAFADKLESVARDAVALAELGDALPVGVRELAARIATNAPAQAATVRVIVDRAPR